MNLRDEEQIGKMVLHAAFHVHTLLGPGLLESVYEAALAYELRKRGLHVERQKAISVFYEGQCLDVGFRADLVVEGLVLVELKSFETVTPLFKKITNNYVRLIPLRLGYLINFNVPHLKDGITRVVNGLEGKPLWSRDDRESGPSNPPITPLPLREIPRPWLIIKQSITLEDAAVEEVSREGAKGAKADLKDAIMGPLVSNPLWTHRARGPIPSNPRPIPSPLRGTPNLPGALHP